MVNDETFHTVRDTWRGTQSYMEKRRGRREIEVTRRRRASNPFPMHSPQSGSFKRCSWSYTEKRRGRKETEVARRIKGGMKMKETDPASNQVP